MSGRTILVYNLYAKGLPKNQHYELCMMNIGRHPRATAGAYLDEDGKVVNVLADPAHSIKEDPINVEVFAAKGEPIQFALVSDDDHWRAFTQIVPFPIEKTSGPCHLTMMELAPYYQFVSVAVTGLQPTEELVVETKSEGQGGKRKAKADGHGAYRALVGPFVKGKLSGKARFSLSAKSCKVGIEFLWGAGSQVDQ